MSTFPTISTYVEGKSWADYSLSDDESSLESEHSSFEQTTNMHEIGDSLREKEVSAGAKKVE